MEPIALLVAAALFVLGVRALARARRAGRGRRGARRPTRGLPALAEALGLPPEALASHAPHWTARSVPKRSGGRRLLHVPDEATRQLQRRLLKTLRGGPRAHPCATAFERGRSIVHNALPHAGRDIVIKIDVVDFFASTSATRVAALWRALDFEEEAVEVLQRLTTWQGGLPMGAPTSPRLSNLVNRLLDERLAQRAARVGAAYTRYADDITFSLDYARSRAGSRRRVRSLLAGTHQDLRSFGYVMHRRRKMAVLHRHRRQTVTGLVVNERVALPRATRRWLRAVEHHAATGRPVTLTEAQRAGWRGLARMVEQQRG